MRSAFRILIALAVLGFAATAWHAYSAKRPASTLSRAQWAQKISHDPRGAYAEFKKEYADAPFASQHLAAHVIGAILYDTVGTSGINICDESFAFGCYHSFFARAIADSGVAAAPKFANACRSEYGKNSTGCEHGIGHGLMEFYGRANLDKALAVCAQIGQADPLFGCSSGVFMEYNASIVIDGERTYVDQRSFDAKDPTAPCDSVPTRFRPSCYFEIGLWWKDVLGLDFEKIGAMCGMAPAGDERAACYRGWGTVVAENVDHSAENAAAACGRIRDPLGVAECATGVASRFAPAGYPAEAAKVCSTVDIQYRAICEKLLH